MSEHDKATLLHAAELLEREGKAYRREADILREVWPNVHLGDGAIEEYIELFATARALREMADVPDAG